MTLQLIIETLRRERLERVRNQRQKDEARQRDNPVKVISCEVAPHQSRLPGHPAQSPTMTASTKARLAGHSVAPRLQSGDPWLARR